MEILRVKQSRLPSVDFDHLGFGDVFSDHMVSMEYRRDQWSAPRIHPFGAMRVFPSLFTLHYGQSIFEGVKAFYAKDGVINIFRPDKHCERFNKSARRLAIPEIPPDIFIQALKELIKTDRAWVPAKRGCALYIRPLAFGAKESLRLLAPTLFRFFIMTSPVAGLYCHGPVKLRTSGEYIRAARGGVGDIKTSGNYASCIMPAEGARRAGFDQVLWLDAIHHKYVEEAGTMNIFFVIDGALVTAPLEGTILPGITRSCILTIAREWGVPVEERRISINEVLDASCSGALTEAFGTGTAAVVSPISLIEHDGKKIDIPVGAPGAFTERFYDEITGIQYGEKPDRYGWCYQV